MYVALTAGCTQPQSAQWLINGFLDPTQVGQFLEPKRNEIRSVLSILEEPIGIQGTEEPTADDLMPRYEDVKIAPGDILNISIYELLNPGETTAQQVRVSTSGYETLPVLGRIRLAGLTTRELELELKARLREAGILDDAEVQVILVDSRGAQYSVLGSVPRAGTYTLPSPDYRLLNAIAEAGGVPPQIDRIYVFRRTQDGVPLPAEPASVPATEPAALSMSDVSSSPASRAATSAGYQSSTGRAADSAPALAAPRVDELKILEGGPEGQMPRIRWDPVKQDWLIEEVASGPSTGRGPGTAASEPGAAVEPPAEGGEESGLASAIRVIEIPTKELLDGDPRYNIVVRSFDVINVPPGNVGEYYMMGNVTRTGAYDLTGRRLTVKEAIASAGGFSPLAWPSRADLVRRISRDEEQIIQLDLDAIFAGTSPDFYLRPNDIVNVGSTPQAIFLAVLRNAFRFSYGFGFVYDRNFADEDTFQARETVRQRRNQEALARGLPI